MNGILSIIAITLFSISSFSQDNSGNWIAAIDLNGNKKCLDWNNKSSYHKMNDKRKVQIRLKRKLITFGNSSKDT